jgi:ribonuclease HI
MGHREVKIRLAIIEAIKITTRWGVNKHIIMTDSLSNIVAQEETFTRGNSKKMLLKDLMAEEGSNLKLMWVPAHVGIKGNETADKEAKEALNQEVDNTYKVVKSDWSKWVKRKSWQVRTNGNPQETSWRRLNVTSVDTV